MVNRYSVLGANIILLMCLLGVPNRISCESPDAWWQIGRDELEETLAVVLNQNIAKNVIVFVGDGMSVATVSAARILQGQLKGERGEEGYLHFEKFPHTGLLKPYSNDNMVSESSASGTALFSGMKANSETIGVNSNAIPRQCKNSSLHRTTSVLHWAQEVGKSTGIITNTHITDSTPAALFGYTADEEWEADVDIPVSQRDATCRDLALQLIDEMPGKRINLLFGGGLLNFLPVTAVDPISKRAGRRQDKRHLVDQWVTEKAENGSRAAFLATKEELLTVANDTEFLLGLFAPGLLTYALDQTTESTVPTLTEMAVKAVQVLSSNPNGYFLMVEGGLIDVAHHRGIAARALHETLALTEAVKAVDAITDPTDTLIIVLADHSHSLIFMGYQPRGSPILGFSSPRRVLDGLPFTILLYASGAGGAVNTSRADVSLQDTTNKDYQQQSLIPMKWARHLGEDVPIYAKGPMSHLFTGVHELHYFAHAVNYAACYRNDTSTKCNSNQK